MQRQGRRIPWNQDQLRQWIEVEGLTQDEVAQRMETNHQAVSKACARFRIQCQRRGPRGGSGHPDWNGGRMLDKHGYVLVYRPGHPMARKQGKGRTSSYVLEHRLVMAEHLGRILDPLEVVHHKNKNVQDNRIENLELYTTNAQHLKDELAGRCPNWTEEGRQRILEGTRKTRRHTIHPAHRTGDLEKP